jgi:hypothetical protein
MFYRRFTPLDFIKKKQFLLRKKIKETPYFKISGISNKKVIS